MFILNEITYFKAKIQGIRIIYIKYFQNVSILDPIILPKEDIFAITNGPHKTLPNQVPAIQYTFPY